MSWFNSIPGTIPVGNSGLLLAGEALAIAQNLPTNGSWREDPEGRIWADRPSPDWEAVALFVMTRVQLDQMVEIIRTAPATLRFFGNTDNADTVVNTDNTELPPDTVNGNEDILDKFFIRDRHGFVINSDAGACHCPWVGGSYADKGAYDLVCEELDGPGTICQEWAMEDGYSMDGEGVFDCATSRNSDLSKLVSALWLREALTGANLTVTHGFAVDGSISFTSGPQYPEMREEFGLRGNHYGELDDEPMAVFLAAREATGIAAQLMA